MIIDPESFVPLELDRRLAATRATRASRVAIVASRRRRRTRRGITLRLVAWVTGRTAFV